MGAMHNGGHHDHRQGGIPLWAVKFFAAVLMAVVCAAGCFLPVWIAAQAQTSRLQQQERKRAKYRLLQALLSLINCFAADCHRDPSTPLTPQEGDEAAVPVFPSFVDLSRCRDSTGPPRLLQHPSHHHVQHHLLCTGANYCPGCDDCAEAATAAPAAGAEASGGAADAVSGDLYGRRVMPEGGNSDCRGDVGLAEERPHQEGATGGQCAVEKLMYPKLQLTYPEGNTLQRCEMLELYKQDEDKTLSRETANTSSGSNDSSQKKSGTDIYPIDYADGMQRTHVKMGEKSSPATPMWTEEHYAASSRDGCPTKEVPLQGSAGDTSSPAYEDQAETGITEPSSGELCETASIAARGTKKRSAAVWPTVPRRLSAASVTIADEEKETELSAWNDKVPHLHPQMTVGHEARSSATNRDITARETSGDNGTTVERAGDCDDKNKWLSGPDNSTMEPCCTSDIHRTSNQNTCLPALRGKECSRDRKAESTAATPGATGGDRSVASPHSRCGCTDFQATGSFTPCCCCSGFCKKCGDHSHDPESGSRVHSGSMGANVQGGDSAVEQERGALNGTGRPTGGTEASDVEPHVKREGTVTHKVEKEAVRAASPSASRIAIHSLEPLSPRSNSVHCCGCCHKAGSTRQQSTEFSKKHRGHQQLQQQRWLRAPAGRQVAKADIRLIVAVDDGEQLPSKKRTRPWGRLLKWNGHFDAAKWSLAVALGVHAIFEGVILGATMKSQDVWIAALAILGHKAAEGVALSSTLLRLRMVLLVPPPLLSIVCRLRRLTRLHFILTLGLFVLASPFGVFLGAVATMGGTGVCGIFNALAVGAVLYTTNEMLSEFAGRSSRVRRVLKLLAFAVGLGVLFGLDLLHAPFCTQHAHKEAHGHHHHRHHHHHHE